MASLIPSGSASGTGSVTLTVPTTNSNQTATLPDATGTVMVSGNMPAFCATMTASQSVSSGTFTAIQFNSVSGGAGFDTASAFNTSTYRFTPQVAGYYSVSANLNGPASSVGYISSFVFKNGSVFENLGQLPNFTGGACTNGNIIMYLNGSSDFIQIYVYQTTGTSALIYSGNLNGSYFSASLLRAA